jgi:hypothetical protein
MGRNALSNADKLVTGSAPKPELRPGAPAKPTGLSPRAAVEWDRLSQELQEAGLHITVAHRAPLTLAATIAADLFTDWEVIKKDGAYIQGRTGWQHIRPSSGRTRYAVTTSRFSACSASAPRSRGRSQAKRMI